jgi:hypothetical protein
MLTSTLSSTIPLTLTGHLVFAERWDTDADCADGTCQDLSQGTPCTLLELPGLCRSAWSQAQREGWPEGDIYFTDHAGRLLGPASAYLDTALALNN